MAQETASMNDGRAIPKLGLVIDAHATTQDVEAALDAGVAHIHLTTSHAHIHAVGGALQNRPRERVFVTMAWSGMSGDNAVEVDLRTSLQRLNLSHVDLYLLPFSASDAWGAMEHVRDVGLARSIGVLGFDAAQLAALLASAKHPPAVNQLEFTDLSPKRLQTLQFCAERDIAVATTYSLELLAPQVRTIVDVIAECEEVAPETVLLAWARAKEGVALMTQVPQGVDFTLSAADAASIDEAAFGERDAGFVRETGPDATSAPAVPTADVSHPSALAAAGPDQSLEDAAPPPYSVAAPILSSPTSALPSLTPARPPRFDHLGVVELGHILTPEELVAWREMDRRRFRLYRFCTRTVLFAIWAYLVPVAMYESYLRWRALQNGRS